MKMSLKRMND